jgi:hypothetical protein
MTWTAPFLDHLAEPAAWAYRSGQAPATEPAALAALALIGHARPDVARAPLDWLASLQAGDGRIGIDALQKEPNWPTLWAILAWTAHAHASSVPLAKSAYIDQIELALRWMLTQKGRPIERSRELGHDSTLVGWPWVASTHSWLEPTCLAVLALRATGRRTDARCEEAIRLLTDRLLPRGGANYGNTLVLGQELLAHFQPTGLVLLALAGLKLQDERLPKTVAWLEQNITADLPGASLAYALMGLATADKTPPTADDWLRDRAEQSERPNRFLPVRSLALLAALGPRNPLVTLPRALEYDA